MIAKPKFVDSPYFVDDPDNWHLLPGAPEEVEEEFEEYIKYQKECSNNGIDL